MPTPTMRGRLLLLFAFAAAWALAQTEAPANVFEVASIKRAPPPGDSMTQILTADHGTLNYSNVTLQEVLGKAFGVRSEQLVGPPWFATERYDIRAKFPPRNFQIAKALQRLLEERFALRFHRDQKVMSIQALVIAKGGLKMHAAELEEGLRISTGPNGQTVTGTASMDRLAALLSRAGDNPVYDMTGLKGPFAIQLQWDPTAALPSSPGGDERGASIYAALREQLGLRVEAAKRPVEIIVVDHLEKAPTTN